MKILPFLLRRTSQCMWKNAQGKARSRVKLARVPQIHGSTEIKYAVPESITCMDFSLPVMKEKHK